MKVVTILESVSLKPKKMNATPSTRPPAVSPLYLFLPSCPLILCPIISSPPSLHPATFPALSSPAFRAFILLHLPFPFRDPFSPFNIALLALLPPDPLPSCSSSSLGFACLFLRGLVQQGRVTFLGCLLHMVHIPAGLL